MRKLAGLIAIVLLSLTIAACGDEDDANDATEEAATETAVTADATEAPTEAVTEEATDEAGASTPEMAATPAVMATPAGTAATPVASPVPVTSATPAPVVVAGDDDTEAATPSAIAEAEAVVLLSGEVTLPGSEGETFVITENGCVGLNGYSDIRAGRQLVVRDETGTIIGVTEIEGSGTTDSCTWTFAIEVPESTFYSVTIPMTVERVFSQDDVDASGGEITVPLG